MSCGEKTKALIWLSMSESLTPRGRRLLLEEYGCPERALQEFGQTLLQRFLLIVCHR